MNAPTFEAGRPRHRPWIRRVVAAVGPVARPMAGTRVFPLWAILRHTGRTSGTAYATPVVARPTADGFIIPLPFGDATQWARNVFAAGGGTVRQAGREHRVCAPEVIDVATAAPAFNPVIRVLIRLTGIRQFVRVRLVDGA